MYDQELYEIALSRLFNQFPATKCQLDDGIAQAFLRVARPFSIDALHATVDRFGLGEVPNQDMHFGPSTAELAAECRLQEKVLRHLERRPAIAGIEARREYSLEHREKMALRLKELARSIGTGVPDSTLQDDTEKVPASKTP